MGEAQMTKTNPALLQVPMTGKISEFGSDAALSQHAFQGLAREEGVRFQSGRWEVDTGLCGSVSANSICFFRS